MSRYTTIELFRLAAATVLIAAGCAEPARAEPAASESRAMPVSKSVESGPVRVTVELDRDEAIVPEPITLTLTVEAERGVNVIMPEIDELLGEFLVQEIAPAPPFEDDMHRRETWSVRLEPVLPGDTHIPSMLIVYEDRRERADGTRADVVDGVATPVLQVLVAQHLADVKNPASLVVPRSYTLLAWLLGIIVAMAAAALVARWLNRGETPEVQPAEATVPAHVWALAQLDMLAAEGLLERGRVQEWYYRINAIVRQYIERRFGLMAGEQTSEEFLRDLQKWAGLSAEHKQLLQRFVSACDPVKYAKHQPDAEETRWVDASARNFVVQTAHAGVDDTAQGPRGSRSAVNAGPIEQGVET